MPDRSRKYFELENFIREKMRMSHIYQPVMMAEILRGGGTATVTEIAKELLRHDPSQVEYYENITKNMVGKILTNNGVTEKIKDGRNIREYQIPHFDQLSGVEVDDLISLCSDKIDEYISRRGDQIWSHRRKSSGVISGTFRYEVFKRARFRCELCGISAEEKALEVDHIIPRNKGGKDELSNFQALCFSCNAMKRDRDDTDFRGMAESYSKREENCLFCEMDEGRVIGSNELCFAIRDNYPVTEHHTLIIPKRHVSGFFDLHQPEINAVHSLLCEFKTEIEDGDNTVSGFNVGINSGETAGQTIFHCHIHLIPRRAGDIENPRGGVRGVIPDKRIY